MRQRLVHAGAWLIATGAAVMLSWFSVHTVLSGTVYDPPRATPAPRPERPSSSRAPRELRDPLPRSPTTPRAGSARPSPPPAGTVESFTADGGRVVLDLRRDRAALVSATPDSGWRMRVRKQETSIRVTFTKGDRESSVFCAWRDTAPRVRHDERQT